MGGTTSKRTLLQKHGQLLSENEREAVFSCFIAITSDQEAEGFTKEQLTTVGINASNDLVEAIYNGLSGQHSPGKQAGTDQVSFTSFVQNLSWILKGSYEQKSMFFQSMVGTSLRTIENLLLDMFESLLQSPKSLTHLPEIHHWSSNTSSLRILISFLTQPLKQTTEDESDSHLLKIDELQQWLTSTPMSLQVLQILVSLMFISHHTDIDTYVGSKECPDQLLIPSKIVHPLVKEKFKSSLLDHATVMFINSALPFEQKGIFYPLFSSRNHGESFSTLCKQILNRGPTLLIVKDEHDHVFGGFAKDDWKFNPQFRGSSDCFLFTLSPIIGVHNAAGYNENYMYLQQSAQTLPNGLGMGGQIDYYGLWLSSEFGSGHSKARPKCTTYGSPCLAGTEEFRVQVLEAWGVGQPVLPDPDDQPSGPASILDKDNIAKAMLEIAGKKQHSDGLREPEDIDT